MNVRQRLIVVGGGAATLALAIYPPFAKDAGNLATLSTTTTSIGRRFLWQMHSERPTYIDYTVIYRPDILWVFLELSLVVLLTGAGVWVLRRKKETPGPRTTAVPDGSPG
jgi:hypothetical protein